MGDEYRGRDFSGTWERHHPFATFLHTFNSGHDVFDFEPAADDIAHIAALDTGASLFLDHRDPNVARQLGAIRIN